MINTQLFHPGTFVAVAAITVFVYWGMMRFAPGVINGKAQED